MKLSLAWIDVLSHGWILKAEENKIESLEFLFKLLFNKRKNEENLNKFFGSSFFSYFQKVFQL